MNNSSKWIAAVVLVAALFAAIAYYIVSNPENPIMKYFRGGITATDARIIVGPYPLERDMSKLKSNGVTTLVSLLNPKLPYEKSLLNTEAKNAAKYGLRLLNFPMNPVTSMMHQNGGDNQEEANEAVAAIKQTKGRVYVHCYLGIHRAITVKKMLDKQGLMTAKYLQNKGERDDRVRKLDKAQADFEAGRYKEVVDAFGRERNLDPRERILLAWSRLRLNDAPGAAADFSAVLRDAPGTVDANNGLGYSSLRTGDTATANTAFEAALAAAPRDASALTGLGIVRYRQGRLPESVELLKKALEISPGNSDAEEALERIPAQYRK